jgi:hypothetical protein
MNDGLAANYYPDHGAAVGAEEGLWPSPGLQPRAAPRRPGPHQQGQQGQGQEWRRGGAPAPAHSPHIHPSDYCTMPSHYCTTACVPGGGPPRTARSSLGGHPSCPTAHCAPLCSPHCTALHCTALLCLLTRRRPLLPDLLSAFPAHFSTLMAAKESVSGRVLTHF